MYAIGILPLINQLKSTIAKQVWIAGDATASARLHHLHIWWTKLNELGPAYGYFANCKTTWLIVKEKYLPIAMELFSDSGVNITNEGKRHLGAAIGSRSFVESYMQNKVKEWSSAIHKLAATAKTLEGTIRLHLIPALTGRESVSDIERDLFSIPTRLGGLGIIKPMETAERCLFMAICSAH